VTALYFLLGALVISAIGSLIVVLRHREPRTEDWSVEEFRREMQALSPEAGSPRRMPPPPALRPRTAHPVRPPRPPGSPDRAGDRGR
jgi:hypothetical protein